MGEFGDAIAVLNRFHSPSVRLVAGVLVTLSIIVAYAGYTIHSVRRMRQVQTAEIDQNRRAALQLLRIQSDLNALALALRDMLENSDGYPLSAWGAPLDRMRENLQDAIRSESRLSSRRRDPQQTNYLLATFQQFWNEVDRMKGLAQQGDEAGARKLVRQTLAPQQEALSALTSRLLVQNNEAEQAAAAEIAGIYEDIERKAYLFLALSVALTLAVSGAAIRSNRQLFLRLAELSNQRKELAQQLIATQESMLRSLSRDLHDEFGQILTAVGAMLKRAGGSAPPAFQEQLTEIREILQETLDKVRSLSQSLQPVILEEQGLAEAVQWHILAFQRQTGITVDYQREGPAPDIAAPASIHVFRILQEALNNVARHAQVDAVQVRLRNSGGQLELVVEDHGVGRRDGSRLGVGLTGMRERAGLLGGTLEIGPADPRGTRVALRAPEEGANSGDSSAVGR